MRKRDDSAIKWNYFDNEPMTFKMLSHEITQDTKGNTFIIHTDNIVYKYQEGEWKSMKVEAYDMSAASDLWYIDMDSRLPK